MEQIKQLKEMRDAAKARIEATPDYKLMTSLDALIADLEKAFGEAPAASDDAAGGGKASGAGGGSGSATGGPSAAPQAKTAKSSGNSQAGIFNGNAAKAANPEEDAIDQAVAELEAELVSVHASDKNH
jgi:hypothetical protein